MTGKDALICDIYARMSTNDIRRARVAAHGDAAKLAELIAEKVAGQLDECREYAADQDPVWAVRGVYSDNMISGAERYRGVNQHPAERIKMLADIARRGTSVIILATEVSRLYRDVTESRELIELARHVPITVATVDDEEFDLSGDGDGESAFEGAVSRAARESGKVSRRRRRKESNRAKAGGYWGTEPFGYHKVYEPDPETGRPYYTGRLVLCDETCPGVNGCANVSAALDDDPSAEPGGRGEAALIHAAARRIVGTGDEPARSLHWIVRDWDELGIRTRAGKKWGQVQLRSMLLNKRLNGTRVHRAGNKFGRADRKSAGVETKGNWPAILDDDLFMAVQGVLLAPAGEVLTSNGKLIKVNRTMAPGGNARRHLLAGLAFCGLCGARMKGHPGPRKVDGSPTTRYKCPSPPDGCGHTHRSAEIADAWVIAHILRWTAPDGPYAGYVERERGMYAASELARRAELGRIDEKLAADAGTKAGIVAALAAGDLAHGSAEYDINMAAVRQIETRGQEMSRRRAALLAAVPPAALPSDPAELAARLAPETDVRERHEIIRRYVARVIIKPPGGGTRYVFDPDTIVPVPGPWADGLDPQELAGAVPPGVRYRESARVTVAAYLGGHPGATPREIAEALGRNHGFVCTVLAAMRDAGEVIPDRPGRGGGRNPIRYALPGAELPPAVPAGPQKMCNAGRHLLNEANTYTRPGGRRLCRACVTEKRNMARSAAA